MALTNWRIFMAPPRLRERRAASAQKGNALEYTANLGAQTNLPVLLPVCFPAFAGIAYAMLRN
ncbi:hypothetical protein [Burkholderia sp. 8Y]|uniref:hypothetical protein n=1 Tax=Burkholderia sp. 8Y TaxID=2653133 RepID=UPI00135B662A|nr:hypothetical protein [Burkholderia sp. 8Y]